MTEAFRQIYWNVGEAYGATTLYLTALIALGVMTWGILRDIGRWGQGRPDRRISELPARAIESLAQIFGQKRVLRDRQPGSMHALIFFGFLALFIGTDIIAVEEDFTVPLIGAQAGKILVGGFYQSYEFILDLMGLVFITGLVWAAWRRYKVKPDRLHTRGSDSWVLVVLLYIATTGYIMEGLRLANQTIGGLEVYSQSWAANSFIGFSIATLFRAIGLGHGSVLGLGLHALLWYSHMLATFAFIASIPLSKFRHMIYTPLNGFFRDTEPKGALAQIPNLDAEIEKDEPKLGVATLADMTWKQRLDLDSCMSCGRCQSKCPAYASGSQLSPKFLITKLADLQRGQPSLLRDGNQLALEGISYAPSSGNSMLDSIRSLTQQTDPAINSLPLYEHGLFSENELWACTTCRACMEECPALIEHVDLIVDMRRNLTMIQSEVPSGVKRVLEGIERQGNPWRLPARNRMEWAAGLALPTMAEKEHVDVLYWVGCAPSYDDRSKKVARTMIELFQRAGIDFAVLAEEETCTGDPARRMGEELLFQQQAQQNVGTLGQYSFKRLVTTCAHCFNTIKNEYPQFGGRAGIDYEVIHHTEFLAQLVAEGKLTPTERVEQRVVYHDPCYIGRYNDLYDPPRSVLQAIPGLELVEAPESRQRAMCCGGGGGNAWLEGWGNKNVNVIRLEQLRKTEPEAIAVACPFCMVMFEDATKNTGVDETIARRDVAEILLQSLPPNSTSQ